MTINKLLEIAAKVGGVSVSEIKSQSRQRAIVRARMAFFAVGYDYGYSRMALITAVNVRGMSAVTYARKRVQTIPALRDLVKKLAKKINKRSTF